MGFWHTGYAEFHEEVGFGDYQPGEPPAPSYPCDECGDVFGSIEALRTHRFERHPIRQPVLLIRGVALGRQPFVVKTKLKPSEVALLSADEADVNGRPIGVAEIGTALAAHDKGTVQVRLGSGRLTRTIHFRIATPDDLIGVEKCFQDTAAAGRLDRRAVENFIRGSRRFRSAGPYLDGICQYLYGVLAKERSSDIDIPYEQYRDKFNQAMDSLSDIHRPLAQQITSLIDFNLNLLASVERRDPASRVGTASIHLLAWGRGDLSGTGGVSKPRTRVDRALTDTDTEAIVAWSCQELADLANRLDEIEEFARKPLAELDKTKCQLILAALYLHRGEYKLANEHARKLYHLENPQLFARGLAEAIDSKVR